MQQCGLYRSLTKPLRCRLLLAQHTDELSDWLLGKKMQANEMRILENNNNKKKKQQQQQQQQHREEFKIDSKEMNVMCFALKRSVLIFCFMKCCFVLCVPWMKVILQRQGSGDSCCTEMIHFTVHCSSKLPHAPASQVKKVKCFTFDHCLELSAMSDSVYK